MLFLGYCQFFHKTQTVIELVKPVQAACQAQAGCPKLPKGWLEVNCSDSLLPREKELYVSGPTYCAILKLNATELGTVFYSTNTHYFYINWRYYSDSVFYAEGGKTSTLTVTRYVKGAKTVIFEEK